jgi:hypothetical protein
LADAGGADNEKKASPHNCEGVMMPIAVSCRRCGKTLTVGDQLAGKKVQCPACQAVLVVPSPVAKETFKLADVEPEPVQRKPRRFRDEPEEDEQKERRDGKKRGKGARGCLNVLVFLATGILLLTGCAGGGVFVWFRFYNFTGHELVGTWETDPPNTKDRYGLLRFNRFGDITVMPPGKPISAKGNWRVVDKKDKTFYVEITNEDGSGKIDVEITLLTPDRIRVVLPRPSLTFELRRSD